MTVFNLGPGNTFFNQSANSNDQIFGEGGNDTLDGGTGSDDLFGGAGNDQLYDSSPGEVNRYYGGGGDDGIFTNNADFGDIIDGGIGVDRVSLAYSSAGSFGLTVMMGSSLFVLLGGAQAVNIQNCEALTISCTDNADLIVGGDYDDVINAFNGNDTLKGGKGNDSFSVGTTGTKLIEGGKGLDKLTATFSAATGDIVLQAGVNTSVTVGALTVNVRSIEAFDVRTGAGNDQIVGGDLADRIDTGLGNDGIASGAGDDTINSGAGGDVVYAGAGNDTVNGPVGFDTGGAGKQIYGGDGNDQLGGWNLADTLIGGMGDDRLYGGGGSDSMMGGDGNDVLQGGYNNAAVTLSGGAGDDFVYVSLDTLADNVSGGNGLDLLAVDLEFNSNRFRVMEAGFSGGNYRITVDGAQVVLAGGFETVNISGGARGDTIRGGDGNDTLRGWGYNGDATDTDRLSGGKGNDSLFGMAGNDTLTGGTGADRLNGGLGADLVSGGKGADLFAVDSFVLGAGMANRDEIAGFAQGRDRLDLSVLDANTLTVGVNDAFDFIEGGALSAAGQVRAGFDSLAGNTTVEADLNGDGVADVVLVLKGQFTLTDADFML